MKKFIPSEYLKEAVENRDLLNIKTALTTYITKDPADTRGNTLKALEYAKTHAVDLLEKELDNGAPLEKNSEKWDKAYLARLIREVDNNFSEKRFLHAYEVGLHIYGKEDVQQENSIIKTIGIIALVVLIILLFVFGKNRISSRLEKMDTTTSGERR